MNVKVSCPCGAADFSRRAREGLTAVGAAVGGAVGSSVGDAVGYCCGTTARDQVQRRSSMGGVCTTLTSVGAAVGEAVGSKVGAAVGD
jgi:hypothetical protein